MGYRYICLIFKPSDLRLLDHLSAKDIKQTLFIPFSLEECFCIKQKGLPVDPAWGYYSLDEVNDQYWENIGLAQHWFQRSAGKLEQNGLSIAAADTMFLYYFFVECNFFNVVLSRILTQYKSAVFIAREQFGIFQKGHQDNEDTPLGIFHFLCDRLAVKVRRIEIQRRTVHVQRPNVAEFPEAPENVLEDRKESPRLLLVSSGGNYFREYLTATRNLVDVAACYCETLAAPTFQALKAMTSAPTLYIGRRRGLDEIDKSDFWSAYNAFEAETDTLLDANSHIFRNPYFHEFFRWIFTVRWPAVAELANAAAAEESVIAGKIDFAIVPALPIAEMTVLGHVLRSWRIPILWQAHGINVFPEHLSMVLGKEPKAEREWVLTSMVHQLDGSAYEKNRIHIGSLSHNNLFRALRNHTPMKRFLANDSRDGPIRILIVTNGLSYGNIPLVDMGHYLDMLRIVLDIPVHMVDKVEIIFKPKPMWEPISLFEHVKKYAKRSERIHILQSVPMAAAIDLTDICVGVGPETSAYIDAIVAGKPLIRLREEGRQYFDRGDNCQLPQHIYVNVGDGRDLWAKIEKLMFDRDYYAQVVGMQNEALVLTGLVRDVSEQLKKAAEIACRVPLLEHQALPPEKVPPKSGALTISVKKGHVDSADIHGKFVLISGWAGDMTSGAAALAVLVVADGKVLTSSPLTRVRPDVPRRGRNDSLLGFAVLAPSDEVLAAQTVTVIAVFGDGQLYPLHATGRLRKESCIKQSYKGMLPDKPLFERNFLQFSGAGEGAVDDLTIMDGGLVFSGWVRDNATQPISAVGLAINRRIVTLAIPKIDDDQKKGRRSRARFTIIYSTATMAHDADEFSIFSLSETGAGGVLPFAFNVRRQLASAQKMKEEREREASAREAERQQTPEREANSWGEGARRLQISRILGRRYWSYMPPPLRLKLQMAAVRRSGLFDRNWYSVTYKDVAATGVDPLKHFVKFGFREGRKSNARG